MKVPKRITWRHIGRLYEAVAPFLKAAPLKRSSPEAGRVLVCAPHIDDEMIGAGGTLRKHVLAGDEVKTLYIADCTAERIAEARSAAAVIGIINLEFCGYASKSLPVAELTDRLARELIDYRPDVVYLPSLFDRHNDHLAVNHCLCLAHRTSGRMFAMCGYEVWTALVPNLVVDISETADAKRRAIAEFRSQVGAHDWADAALSLNRFRAVTSGAGAHAEGFMRLSAAEYCRIWEKAYAR